MQKIPYVAKSANIEGIVEYDVTENAVWQKLISRQIKIIEGRACQEFISGLVLLNLPQDRVPQCDEVSAVLEKATGWRLEPVPALISFERFFELLASRRFPAATFIRRLEELDYIQEPDIFHEIFGHCPLLTHPAYAEFVYHYGKLGMKANAQEKVLLARLFWFTIEFGLIQSKEGVRAYGGGILSSMAETVYCVESKTPERKPFDVIDALQTAYRIDVIQPIYFILEKFDQLYDLIKLDLLSIVRDIHRLDKQSPRHPC